MDCWLWFFNVRPSPFPVPLPPYSYCHNIGWWLIEWSGINALLYYGPTIVGSIGLGGDTVTLVVSGGISVVQFLAVLPSIVLIDRLGEFLFSILFLVLVLMMMMLGGMVRQETASSRYI